jgi:hypothetical protein
MGTTGAQGLTGGTGLTYSIFPFTEEEKEKEKKCLDLARNILPYADPIVIETAVSTFMKLSKEEINSKHQELMDIEPFNRYDLAKMTEYTGPK